MREILFRAKRVDNGEWVEGYYSELPIPSLGCIFKAGSDEYIACEDTSSYIIEIITKQHPYFSSANPMQVVEFEKYEVDAETVGEFTGLCDKNGKKVFEGDIISSDNNGKFIIKWNNNKAKFVCGFVNKSEDYFGDYYCNLSDKYIKQTFNVIGNIHDNPELLEVEE
ncbi:MAG: YopX family protein [Clostridia bacterium]